MNTIDTNRVVDGGLAGFEKGVALTNGLLQLEMATPTYMTMGDALGAFTEERQMNGDHPLNIAYRDLVKPESSWIFGRVLLQDVVGVGSLPLVVMPDPKKRLGMVRFVQFNQPYDPRIGLDEGQLLALSFETTTKEDAGFGGHAVNSPFEGGHFAVATIASRMAERAVKIKKDGHSGTHQILDESVAVDFNRAGLTSQGTPHWEERAPLPLPKYKDVDVLKLPNTARFIAKWHEKMVDVKGKPLVAAHPEAAQVLLGTVIENLGLNGIDSVGNFINDVRR